jgi:uncharacterized protein (DUF111 family)
VLRAWLGETATLTTAESGTTSPEATFDEDLVLVLETQLDDQSPELLPYLRTQLEQNGAIDVLFTPTLMKKGRPGNIITILSPREKLLTLTRILFRESSALGLRWYPAGRLKLFRTIEEVDTPYGKVPVKLGYARREDGARECFNLAPEYEACVKRAEATGASLKEIYQASLSAARGNL